MKPDPAERRRRASVPRLAPVVVALVCLTAGRPDGHVAARADEARQAGAVVPAPPHRAFVSARQGPSTLAALVDDLIAADVVFLGEQHGNGPTHQLELALLQQIGRRRDVILALEMFERDVQEPLEHFVMGHLPEAEFLKDARPWPRYATDYKPLVDLAIAREWTVVAANVPRSLAAEVARSGASALENRPDRERGWFAAARECPTSGPYFARFRTALTNHRSSDTTSQLVTSPVPGVPLRGGSTPSSVPPDDATVARYYLAQCLKDETMAESIAQAHAGGSTGGRKALVVSVNGGFHSEFGQGVVAATGRRMVGKRLATIAIVPVADLSRVSPDATDWARADYLIYTSN